MKVLTLLMLAVGTGRTIAQNLTVLLETCGNSGFVYFNNTNVGDLAPCTHLNYMCSDANTNKSSLGSWQLYNTSVTNSSIYCRSFAWDITTDSFEDTNLTGALVIPGVEIVSSADFSGGGPKDPNISDFIEPSSYLNLTDLELPDLTTIKESLSVQSADKLDTLSFPKLETIRDGMIFNLSGFNPPAINLSFPSLRFVNSGIDISGNIDALDVPMLNETFKFTINSIGNLDCEALVNQVLNATPYSDNSKPVVCNSNKASITTVRPAPVYPSARSGGSLKVQRDSLLRVILFGSFPFLLRLYLILWFAV